MSDLKKPQLAVGRKLDVVTLTIRCESQCAAKELYDRVCADAREGFVGLELATVPRG